MYISGININRSKAEDAVNLLDKPYLIKSILKSYSAREVDNNGEKTYFSPRRNKELYELYPKLNTIEESRNLPSEIKGAYCLEVLWAINEFEKELEGVPKKNYEYYIVPEGLLDSLRGMFTSCIIKITANAKKAKEALDKGSYISGEYYHLLSRVNGGNITEATVSKALYRRPRGTTPIYKQEIHTSKLRKQIQEVVAIKCGVDKTFIDHFIWNGGFSASRKRTSFRKTKKEAYSLKSKITYYKKLVRNSFAKCKDLSDQEYKNIWVFSYRQHEELLFDNGEMYYASYMHELRRGMSGVHRIITDNISCLSKFVGSTLVEGENRVYVQDVVKYYGKVRVRNIAWEDCWKLVFIHCMFASVTYAKCIRRGKILECVAKYIKQELDNWTGVNRGNVLKGALLFSLVNQLGITNDSNCQVEFD